MRERPLRRFASRNRGLAAGFAAALVITTRLGWASETSASGALQFDVFAAQTVYVQGEPVLIHLRLTNVGSTAVTVPFSRISFLASPLRIDLRDVAWQSVRLVIPEFMKWGSVPERVLLPGESVGGFLDASIYYWGPGQRRPFPRPDDGYYHLIGALDIPGANGQNSGLVDTTEFTVVPADGSEADALRLLGRAEARLLSPDGGISSYDSLLMLFPRSRLRLAAYIGSCVPYTRDRDGSVSRDLRQRLQEFSREYPDSPFAWEAIKGCIASLSGRDREELAATLRRLHPGTRASSAIDPTPYPPERE